MHISSEESSEHNIKRGISANNMNKSIDQQTTHNRTSYSNKVKKIKNTTKEMENKRLVMKQSKIN